MIERPLELVFQGPAAKPSKAKEEPSTGGEPVVTESDNGARQHDLDSFQQMDEAMPCLNPDSILSKIISAGGLRRWWRTQ